MPTTLTGHLLAVLQASLQQALEIQQRRLDIDFAGIDRENKKLQKWLGSQFSVKPPQERSRSALREFIVIRDLPTFQHAMLASFGCIDPFDQHMDGLIADPELFPVFLKRVDDYRDSPMALRQCYGGLLHSYFRFEPESGPQPARENWGRLRAYLGDRADVIKTRGVQPAWVESLHNNLEVLGPDPGTYYGLEMFQGRTDRFDEVRKGLAIADASWLVWSVVVGQIEAATSLDDAEFRSAIPKLIELMRKHPLATNFGVAKLLSRYRKCISPTLHAELRDVAVGAWGNPWLSMNEAKWSGVSEDARRMVADWLKIALIQKFFGLLTEDGMNDTRRLKFWESYHQSIHAMYFALGEATRTHTGPDFREIRKQMEGLELKLTHSTSKNNAFIMCINEHVIVEFGEKGNACFIFHKDRLPFKFSDEVAGNYLALKHLNRIKKLLHKDSGYVTWEENFRSILSNIVQVAPPSGPGNPSVSLGSLRQQAPAYPPRQTPVYSPSARPSTSSSPPASRHPTSTRASGFSGAPPAYEPEPATPFSLEELEKFCEQRKLQWSDYRLKGGNLWVYTRQQGTDVAEKLTSWGFRFKNPNGWWRDKK